MTCLDCKYKGIPIDTFRNWCYHPTNPDGSIVLTRTECNEWKKSEKEKIFEEPKKKKMSNNQPASLYKKKMPCQVGRYAIASDVSKRRLRAFSDKYFRGE